MEPGFSWVQLRPSTLFQPARPWAVWSVCSVAFNYAFSAAFTKKLKTDRSHRMLPFRLVSFVFLLCYLETWNSFYSCEIRYLALTEERTLRVCENKELTRIFGLKKDVIETESKLFWSRNVATTQQNHWFSSCPSWIFFLGLKFRKLDVSIIRCKGDVPTQVGLLERVGLDPSSTKEDNRYAQCYIVKWRVPREICIMRSFTIYILHRTLLK
jgi:hypothetical protein